MARSLLFTWAWAALAFPAASAQTSRPESILELLREVDARSQVQDWAGTCATCLMFPLCYVAPTGVAKAGERKN